MKVLSSPSLILIFPLSLPYLPSITRPEPDIGSYSHAPSQVNETPVCHRFARGLRRSREVTRSRLCSIGRVNSRGRRATAWVNTR